LLGKVLEIPRSEELIDLLELELLRFKVLHLLNMCFTFLLPPTQCGAQLLRLAFGLVTDAVPLCHRLVDLDGLLQLGIKPVR